MAFNLSSWLYRKRVKAEVQYSGRPVHAHRVSNPFHAVSIKAGPSCRRTAETYAGRRYLSAEAPSLPLPTCDSRNCRCRYAHHDDRRAGADRRHRDVWSRNVALVKGGDRRSSRGRRATDH